MEYTDITEGQFPGSGNQRLSGRQRQQVAELQVQSGLALLHPEPGRVPDPRPLAEPESAEIAIPGSDLQFYKIVYDGQMYLPITRSWTLRLRTELGYGDGYGSTELVPVLRALLLRRLRLCAWLQELNPGTADHAADGRCAKATRSRRDSSDRKAIPTAVTCWSRRVRKSSSPMPFIKDGRQFRPVVFFDAGNVFQTECFEFSVNCFGFDVDEFRYSVGASLTWLAGLGPMTFSYAFVFNDSEVDRVEQFQFELGRTF